MTTILLIEDNQDFREDIFEILQLEGYHTIATENALLGLQILKEYTPSLIICDMHMPVMNGIELLSIVKADPVLAAIPFLVLTANTHNLSQENLRDSGAEALLSKPIAAEELLSVIAHVLEQHSSSV